MRLFYHFMVLRFELSKKTSAPRDSVLSYFTSIEQLPRVHPNYIKRIKILKRGNDAVTFEQEGVLMKQLRSTNLLTVDRDKGVVEIETLEGDGKGSRVTMTVVTSEEGNGVVTLRGELQLGQLEKLISNAVKSVFERTFDEDLRNLESNNT